MSDDDFSEIHSRIKAKYDYIESKLDEITILIEHQLKILKENEELIPEWRKDVMNSKTMGAT